VENKHGVLAPLGGVGVVAPLRHQLRCVNERLRVADDRAGRSAHILIPHRLIINVAEFVGTLMLNVLNEGVKSVVHVKNAKLVAGLDKGGEGAGLTGSAVADEDELDEPTGMVLGEGYHLSAAPQSSTSALATGRNIRPCGALRRAVSLHGGGRGHTGGTDCGGVSRASVLRSSS